jgi:DNA (cytosine-5)-methyltransferase 1
MTYSFPCQDLSLAGKQKGMAKGENTRSGLLWEVERLLNECTELPQVLLMENVTQVHGKKNKEHFEEWIAFLESKGYSNYWKDLNAKNFGIPQNRNRTFMVSVLGDYTYEFPKEIPLKLRLKDMLETEVDEKYYLSVKQLNYAIDLNDTQKGTEWEGRADSGKLNPIVAMTLGVRSAGGGQRVGVSNFVIDGVDEEVSVKQYKDSLKAEPSCIQAGTLTGGKWDKMHDVSRRVYSEDGIAPTLHTCGGGNTEPEVEQNVELSDREYANAITTVQKDSLVAEPKIIEDFYKNRDELIYEGIAPTLGSERIGLKVAEPLAYDEQNGYIRKDGTVGTLTTDGSSPKHSNRVVENLRIRKLTPKECWRLMGFDDFDFDKAAAVNSNSQLYKQAGNSIVVDVLCYIFGKML